MARGRIVDPNERRERAAKWDEESFERRLRRDDHWTKKHTFFWPNAGPTHTPNPAMAKIPSLNRARKLSRTGLLYGGWPELYRAGDKSPVTITKKPWGMKVIRRLKKRRRRAA